MKSKIPIHLLNTFAYCEYQIYLEKVKGIEVEPTIEMQKGKETHSFLEEEHLKKAELELTVDQAIKKAILDNVKIIGREIPVSGEHIYGLIDEAHFMPYKILIIDDKPGNFPYFSSKLQLWGYCLAFQQQYKVSLPIFACLRNRDTQQLIWDEKFSDEQKDIVINSINRIFGILNGNIKPIPAKKESKCKKCRFKQFCVPLYKI
ncbi:MAG: CRISPR-associated protein Cas4 [Candidatus Altiarchaeota archaeon]